MGGHHHHAYFDPYSRIDSPIHRLPASVKLLAATTLVITLAVAPVNVLTGITLYPFVFLLLMAVAGLSAVPPAFLIRRLLTLEPVVFGVAMLALFQPGGGRVFLGMVLRGTFCLSTMLLLANTTPFADLLEVMRRLRLPSLLVTTLALMYRYLFVMGEELQRLRRARASRTFSPKRGMAWRMIGSTVAHLFIRTTERAERIYAAMCARGWE